MRKVILLLILTYCFNLYGFDWQGALEDIVSLSPIGSIAYNLSKDKDAYVYESGEHYFPSQESYVNNKSTNVTFDDIIGIDEVLVEVKETVEFLKNPQRFIDMGAQLPKGILLEGPPGTGKTLIARAIAGEADCSFFQASGSEFHKKYVGEGPQAIRSLFNQARAGAPSVIFIDEMDAIGSKRSLSRTESKVIFICPFFSAISIPFIDSSVVACIAVEALGKENVLGLAMPSRYSSSSSFKDARDLTKKLGVTYEEISIEDPFQSYLDLLTPHFQGLPSDVTEENLQARIRGMILMAFSNKFGYIVLSSGNKSEMALGFATLYGDLCGGLGVISDLTKRQVYELARYLNQEEERIPLSIIEKEPSAELRPDQKDSDTLPSYALLDAVVEAYIEEGKSVEHIARDLEAEPSLIQDLVRKIHRAEYKRRQSPPGIRVSQKSFREGRKVPIVQKWE